MNCSYLHCDSLHQKCPNPGKCSPTFCDFNNADTPQEKALREFYAPVYPSLQVQMFDKPSRFNRVVDWLLNGWDKAGALGKFGTVVGLVVACALTALVAAK